MSRAAGLALLGLCLAGTAGAQTAEEIVARNVAARGGLEAWRAVKSMTLTGHMDVGHDTKVPYRLELARPRRMRLEFEFSGATAVQTFDGHKGWKLMPFLGKREALPLTEQELSLSAGQAELDGPLVDYQAKGHRVELVGEEEVEGRKTTRLRITLASGAVRDVWIDAETGLETKYETTHLVRSEKRRLETYYRDYRSVGSLTIPHRIETRLEGASTSQQVTVEAVRFNDPLGDERFGMPALTASATPQRIVR